MSTNNNERGRPPRRVLVTGSRTWVNPAAVRDALRQVWGNGDAVLVTGASPSGADRIAEMFWRRWGGTVERHPARWDLHGNHAGPIRNQEMVAKGADVCVAFLRDGSPGTAGTVRLSEHAGIPVRLYTHDSTTGQITSPADTDAAAAAAEDSRRTEPAQVESADDKVVADERVSGATPVVVAQRGPMPARVWLDVPYEEKDEAKAQGARWDRAGKRWYAPAGANGDLSRWTPVDAAPSVNDPDRESEPAARVLTPEELAGLYSYPELTTRIAAMPPDSEGSRQAVAALALLVENPDLYRGGNQISAMATSLTPEQIEEHRGIVEYGPLYDMLGLAAQMQRDADAALAGFAGDPKALEELAGELVASGNHWLAAKALHESRKLQTAVSGLAEHRHAGPAPADGSIDPKELQELATELVESGHYWLAEEAQPDAHDRTSDRERSAAAASRDADARGEPARVWLDVPYRDKDAAKELGARWDREAKRWYAGGDSTEPGLSRWIPVPCSDESEPSADTAETGGAAADDANSEDDTGEPVERPPDRGAGDCSAVVADAHEAVVELNGSRVEQARAVGDAQRLEQLGHWHADATRNQDTTEHAAETGGVDLFSGEERWDR